MLIHPRTLVRRHPLIAYVGLVLILEGLAALLAFALPALLALALATLPQLVLAAQPELAATIATTFPVNLPGVGTLWFGLTNWDAGQSWQSLLRGLPLTLALVALGLTQPSAEAGCLPEPVRPIPPVAPGAPSSTNRARRGAVGVARTSLAIRAGAHRPLRKVYHRSVRPRVGLRKAGAPASQGIPCCHPP